ncbi:MAG: (2Fe-2S)-binding protein [Candidatus Latescibacterota bacterium]|nr:MAG: (2Fe-2S)-binding protein [Candidatus Latescibacterota bacterium]
MIVCECKGLTEVGIRNLIREGWNSMPLLEAATGVGGDCGGCWQELARLLAEELDPFPDPRDDLPTN